MSRKILFEWTNAIYRIFRGEAFNFIVFFGAVCVGWEGVWWSWRMPKDECGEFRQDECLWCSSLPPDANRKSFKEPNKLLKQQIPVWHYRLIENAWGHQPVEGEYLDSSIQSFEIIKVIFFAKLTENCWSTQTHSIKTTPPKQPKLHVQIQNEVMWTIWKWNLIKTNEKFPYRRHGAVQRLIPERIATV